MKYISLFFLLISSMCAGPGSFGQNVKDLVVTCTACHGQNGISTNNLWPNLAGQKGDYLSKQLNAFRSGERKDPLMNPIAQTLTDDDILKLSNYFSGLK